MRALLIALILALVGWIGGGSWYWVCKIKGHCGDGTEVVDDANIQNLDSDLIPGEPDPFIVSYQDKPFIKRKENLRFGKSGVNGTLPANLNSAVDSIATFLISNPNTDVEITGQFSENEENPSDFSNLGLARADYFGQLLINSGLDEGRIIKSYEILNGNNFNEKDTMIGGIRIRLLDQMPGNTEIASNEGDDLDAENEANNAEGDGEENLGEDANKRAAEMVQPEGRDLYFDFKSFNLAMDDELRDYITRSIQYLKQNEDKRLVLTGHTDNVGSPESNMELGKNRAETVKRFFEEFGLTTSQISTASRGESSPLTTNETDAGRSKNRRVEIRIEN